MKKILLVVITSCLSITLFAQRGSTIKWNEEGNAYYASEQNEIVKYHLPSFDKLVLVNSENLTPKGTTTALFLCK